jgi:hypothetical protein
MGDACCKRMAFDLNRKCDRHANRFECPDVLIYRADHGGHGLFVHDGGRSFVRIAFCPWCGSKLPDWQRDETPS